MIKQHTSKVFPVPTTHANACTLIAPARAEVQQLAALPASCESPVARAPWPSRGRGPRPAAPPSCCTPSRPSSPQSNPSGSDLRLFPSESAKRGVRGKMRGCSHVSSVPTMQRRGTFATPISCRLARTLFSRPRPLPTLSIPAQHQQHPISHSELARGVDATHPRPGRRG